jgi:hypothetical protein
MYGVKSRQKKAWSVINYLIFRNYRGRKYWCRDPRFIWRGSGDGTEVYEPDS